MGQPADRAFGRSKLLLQRGAILLGIGQPVIDTLNAFLEGFNLGWCNLLPGHCSCRTQYKRECEHEYCGQSQWQGLLSGQLILTRLCPVISFGCSRPINVSREGATSLRLPPSFRLILRLPVYTRGTGPIVCAVWACPELGSAICSQFPWSAVISASPPTSSRASTTRCTQWSRHSTALMAASNLPVCPTMSPLA